MSDKSYWENGKHLWVTSKDMKSHRIRDSRMKISDEALSIMTQYKPGTILIVTRSGILRHSLPIAILERDATINQDLKAISFYIQDLHPYIYYAIKAQESFILKEYHKSKTIIKPNAKESSSNLEYNTLTDNCSKNVDEQKSNMSQNQDISQNQDTSQNQSPSQNQKIQNLIQNHNAKQEIKHNINYNININNSNPNDLLNILKLTNNIYSGESHLQKEIPTKKLAPSANLANREGTNFLIKNLENLTVVNCS